MFPSAGTVKLRTARGKTEAKQSSMAPRLRRLEEGGSRLEQAVGPAPALGSSEESARYPMACPRRSRCQTLLAELFNSIDLWSVKHGKLPDLLN
eukprot:3639563-Pyramimonas_sp.AAC.1